MKDKMRCSVVMATYNGELYLEEQLDSILRNMEQNDELIISDDGSLDGTRNILQNYMEKDKRIKLIDGPKKGLIRNFENALQHAKGQVIFLCDQDDIWSDHKIDTVLSAMSNNTTLVLHDATVFQKDKELYSSFMQHRGSKMGLINNIIKNSYIGCCMAFKREMLEYVLPFPEKICMHDQWIGLLSEIYGKSVFIKERLLQYRRHGDNASSMTGGSLKNKFVYRVNMIIALLQRTREREKHRK